MRMNMEEKSNREINPTGGGASPSSLLLSLVVSWTAISIVVISISSYSDTALHFFLLIGSILSILGSSLILTTCATHFRKKYEFIYALAACTLLLALKMFATSLMEVLGYDLHWQAEHAAARYLLALSEHFGIMGDLGYCTIILIDVSYPTNYLSHEEPIHRARYHIAVWIAVTLTCIPPIAIDSIGVGDHGTVYFTGTYDGYLLYFQAAFALFSIINLIFLFLRYRQYKSDLLSFQAKPIQMSLMTFLSFALATSWNFAFHISYHHPDDSPPHWLSAVQLFWLGGVGFSSAIVWYPFIRRSLKQVGTHIMQKVSIPQQKRVIVRRVNVEKKITASESSRSLPVYHIPDRWKNETICGQDDFVL